MAINEAQLMPALFPALRVAIDKDRSTYGKYLLSGSSSPELLNSISESLAGRVGIIEIAPLSFSETQHIDTPNLLSLFQVDRHPEEIVTFIKALSPSAIQKDINPYWMQGGYPEPWTRGIDRFREVWNEQYFKTYIKRDITRLFPNLNARYAFSSFY